MTLLIAGIGLLICFVGLTGVVSPQRFRALFTGMTPRYRFGFAIGLRLVMGGLLWWLAPELRFPFGMRILAAIAIAAAVGILIMGQARLDRLVDWWLSRGDGLLRVSASLAAAFGAFLVFVAA